MTDLQQTKEIVRHILEEFPDTRDDNDILYLRVVIACNDDAITMTVPTFFYKRKEMHIPSYESVTRSRRKVQEECPELKGTKTAERAEEERKFIEFART